MSLTVLKQYWKQLAFASLVLIIVAMGFVVSQKNTIIELQTKDIAAKEAQLSVSNSSISALQREVEMQNSKMDEIVQAQLTKQKEAEAVLNKLKAQNATLQVQMLDILNAPETGDECKDITNLLDNCSGE